MIAPLTPTQDASLEGLIETLWPKALWSRVDSRLAFAAADSAHLTRLTYSTLWLRLWRAAPAAVAAILLLNSSGSAARAGDLIPPLAEIKPDHPRLLLRSHPSPYAGSLPELRAMPKDAAFGEMLDRLRRDRSAAAQSMVWLLTGDNTAAERAIATLRGYRFPGNVDTFHIYFTLTQFALAYDWLYHYPGFTAEIRNEVRTQVQPLVRRGLQAADDHVFHNYIWMSAGGVALWAWATAGENPQSNEDFERIRERFNSGLFPAWKYLDGLPSEPMGYWALYVFTPGVLALLGAQSAFEADLVGAIRKSDGDWLTRHFENVIHSTLPDLSYIPWGDLQSGPNGGVTRDMAGIMDATTWATQSATGAFFSDGLAAKRGLDRFRGDTGIFYFLYTRRLKTEPRMPPLSFLAGNRQSGHFIARSGWEDGDTIVAFRSTDHFGDHHHYDQGSFIIYRNGLLAVDPPVYRQVRGPQQPTEAHNTLLLGGKPQRPVRGQWFKTVADFQKNLPAGRQLETGDILFSKEAGSWAAVVGQFAQAYSPDQVQSCVRQLLFVRPDKVVVVDQLLLPANEDPSSVEWLLQLPKPPVAEENRLWSANGKSWLSCRQLFPGNAVQAIEPTAVNTFRATLRYPGKAAVTLVHLLEVGDGPRPDRMAEASARVGPDGVSVVLDGKPYRFSTRSPFAVEAVTETERQP